MLHSNYANYADDQFEMSNLTQSTLENKQNRCNSDTDTFSAYENLVNVRRTQSLHRNALFKNTIDYLPSKYPFGFIKNNSEVDNKDTNLTEYVQHILENFEKNENMMENTPIGEALRIEALRDIPYGLCIKKEIKVKISASISHKSKHHPISYLKRTKYKLSFLWKKTKESFRNTMFSFELWYQTIKTIEGHFGSGITTYFRFLRWLFILNLITCVIVMSFLVIPQLLYSQSNNYTNPAMFEMTNIFTGEGYFTNTVLYYGFYTDNVLNIINGQYYNIPHAYFFTMVFVYIFMFILLSISLARSYRKNFIKTSGGLKNSYASTIFCGWDFSIATSEAALLKSKSIYNDIKESLSDEKYSIKISFFRKTYIFIIKMSINLIIFFLSGSIGFGIWTFLDYNSDAISNTKSIIMAIILTFIMFIFPLFFSYIVRFEKYYSPRTALYITLLRTFTLEAIIVSILTIYWLKSQSYCWETSFGQEIYRLVIFDFMLSTLCLPIFELIRGAIFKHLWNDAEKPEFDIAHNTVGLIYNQTLLWIGLFYSPLLVSIITIKMALLFYIKRFTTLRDRSPITRSWRPSQTQTIFLCFIFLSLLCIILGYVYMFFNVRTGACGPLQNEEYMYLVFLKSILDLEEDNVFFSVMMYLTKPGVIALVLIAMSVGVYCLRARSVAERSMVARLRSLHTLQSKDKEFLLNAIRNVVEGKWIYNRRNVVSDAADDVRSSFFGDRWTSSEFEFHPETRDV